MLACVAGAFHMPLFMAGAITMGRGVASSVVEMRSSAMPLAYLSDDVGRRGRHDHHVGLLRQRDMVDGVGGVVE